MEMKMLLFTLCCVAVVVIVISFVLIHNYRTPNDTASIQDEYKWMGDVQVINTDWYGDKGIVFFVAKGFSDNGEEFCEGYASKNIFRIRTSMENCVPFTNKSNEGEYGTSNFFENPL